MSEMADRVRQFANRFVPKVKVLTARLAGAQRWAEIDPNHLDAIAVRKEIANFDREFTRVLNDLVKLTQECTPYLHSKQPTNTSGDLSDERRIAAALRETTAVVKECTKQEERYATLKNFKTEFLIGSSRFFAGEPSPR